MPIFEFVCNNCKNVVEKIVLKKVNESTVPKQIIEKCKKKCGGALTRHTRKVSAPAYVGLTPPATSKRVTTMAQMRQPKDKDWKKRVKEGKAPDGRALTNLKSLNKNEWEEQVQAAFPDLEEKQKEVAGRVKSGELGPARSLSEFVHGVSE